MPLAVEETKKMQPNTPAEKTQPNPVSQSL